MTRLDVSLGDVSINKVPMLVAADQGIYQKHELDVRQTISARAAQTAAASGVIVPDAYVASDGDPEPPIDVGGGSPMIYRFVNKIREREQVIVLTQESLVMGHVLARSGIERVEDLKGERLGFTFPGAVTHFSALALVRRLGWSAEADVTLVGRSANVEALAQGRVDAITGSAMIIARAVQAGFADIADLTTYGIPMPGSSVMVERDYLGEHRDVVLRFLKATVEATALMRRERPVFEAALEKWFHITDAETQAVMFGAVDKFDATPYPAVEGIREVFAVYDSAEMRAHDPDQFYDAGLVEELDRGGFLAEVR